MCGVCIPYCPMEAISIDKASKRISIDQERCVECGVCIRACPRGAIVRVDIPYPRNISLISDPTIPKITGIPGRGTDEVKTNDVTGRIKRGEAGICIDVGRPNVGAYLRDVEKIIQALISAGVKLEEENPQIALLEDPATGKLKPELREIKVLSFLVEGKTPLDNLPKVIDALKAVEREVDTVFTVGIISRVEEDGRIPALEVLRKLGVNVRPNAKVNVGLGRPLVLG